MLRFAARNRGGNSATQPAAACSGGARLPRATPWRRRLGRAGRRYHARGHSGGRLLLSARPTSMPAGAESPLDAGMCADNAWRVAGGHRRPDAARQRLFGGRLRDVLALNAPVAGAFVYLSAILAMAVLQLIVSIVQYFLCRATCSPICVPSSTSRPELGLGPARGRHRRAAVGGIAVSRLSALGPGQNPARLCRCRPHWYDAVDILARRLLLDRDRRSLH